MESKDITLAKEIQLVDFKVINEPWSTFELSDGSTLKSKYVLVNVFKTSLEKEKKAYLQAQIVLGVFCPENLRGKPSDSYMKEDLSKSIDEEDIDIAKVNQQPWNEYEISSSIIIKVKSMPIQIARTSKFDSQGMPIYLVKTTAIIKSKKIEKK
jgi:hypothetical protein